MKDVSIAEAKSNFSELVSRAAAGERFVIRRRGRAVAMMLSPVELERLERSASAAFRLSLALGQDAALLGEVERHEAHPAMAAFGLWKDAELDELSVEIYTKRAQAASRPHIDL